VFGGRVTQFDPQQLPPGASPYNQDVIYSGLAPDGKPIVGGVATRPGMQNFYPAAFPPNPLGSYSIFSAHVGLAGGIIFWNTTLGAPVIGSVIVVTGSPNPVFDGTYTVTISHPSTNEFVTPIGAVPLGSFMNAGATVTIPSGQPNPTVNYIKTFQDSQGIFHELSLDALGNMRDESPAPVVPVGVPPTIGVTAPGCYAQSDSLINREWIALSHAAEGLDIPRQWDGQYFDRVSQGGPGEAGYVTDEIGPITIDSNSSAVTQMASENIATISQSGNIVTGTTVGSWGFGLVGESVVVSGVTPSAYNGTFVTIGNAFGPLTPNVFQYFLATPSPLAAGSGGAVITQAARFEVDLNVDTLTGNQLQQLYPPGMSITVAGVTTSQYDGDWITIKSSVWNNGGLNNLLIYANIGQHGLSAGHNGTLQINGSILAGLHQLSVCFVTREQYITKPAPFVSWTAAGGKRAVVGNIPIGPPNIIQRIIIATGVITPPAIGGDFYYFDGSVPTPTAGTFPSMVINDNTTTTYSIDFADAVLENATLATYLFNMVELGECSSVCAYSERTFWCGERNKVLNFVNMGFDGGFAPVISGSTVGRPLGWQTNYATPGAAGGTGNGYWQTAFAFLGAHVGALSYIYQNAYQDSLGVPIIEVNTQYSVRFRAQGNGSSGTSLIGIDLYSPSLGISLGAFEVSVSSIPVGPFQEFIGTLMAPQTSLPGDLELRVYAKNGPFVGVVNVDCVEIFPTLQPILRTQVRASYAEDPEAFDQLTGFLAVGIDNGQQVIALFKLLDNKLYMVKERSMYNTADDGQNEPSQWTINTVSDTVGTPSPNGIGIGESWAVIASHDGAYIFWGSEPVKISQEIQPDWDTINWAFGWTIYVVVDTAQKRVHIGAPVNGATVPNVEFVLDYSQLANSEGATSAQDIVAHPQAYYSVYQPGKVLAPGKARKWTIWNISMNCAALTVRSDNSYHLMRGNATGTGKIYDEVVGQLTDDGAAIPYAYQTYLFPDMEQEQILQFGSHRKLMKYLTGYVAGAGPLGFTLYGQQNQRPMALSTITLRNPPPWDFEMNANYISERMSILMAGVGAGSWFKAVKLIPVLQKEIFTPVRGMN